MIENSKGQFGKIFIDSMEMSNKSIQESLNKHEKIFYIIVGTIGIFMIYVISRSK